MTETEPAVEMLYLCKQNKTVNSDQHVFFILNNIDLNSFHISWI
jgi:hypothetical protein